MRWPPWQLGAPPLPPHSPDWGSLLSPAQPPTAGLQRDAAYAAAGTMCGRETAILEGQSRDPLPRWQPFLHLAPPGIGRHQASSSPGRALLPQTHSLGSVTVGLRTTSCAVQETFSSKVASTTAGDSSSSSHSPGSALLSKPLQYPNPFLIAQHELHVLCSMDLMLGRGTRTAFRLCGGSYKRVLDKWEYAAYIS